MRRRRNEEGNLFKAKAMNEVLCSVAQRRKRAMLQREEEEEEDVWRRRCVVFINTVTGEAQAHSVRTERLAERELHRMDATWTRPRAQALRLSRWTLTAAMDHRTRRLKHLHPAQCARLPSLRLTCAVLGRRGLWDWWMGGWVDGWVCKR